MGERIDCRQATEQLNDYLKREMTPALAQEIRAHLDRCRPCFNQARFEENFLRLLEESCGRQRCPGTLRARIVALLQVEAEQD
jgi:anti-sigma factor (TIGR02949 family)